MNSNFKYKAAVQAINYFIGKEGGYIEKMKAIKLLWLTERYHILTKGFPIFNDEIFALEKGPILSTSLDLMNLNGHLSPNLKVYRDKYIQPLSKRQIVSVLTVDLSVFSDYQVSVMEKIYAEYGIYSAQEISELSHVFPEWKRFEENLKRTPKRRFQILKDDLFAPITEEKEKTTSFHFDDEHRNDVKEFYFENMALVG